MKLAGLLLGLLICACDAAAKPVPAPPPTAATKPAELPAKAEPPLEAAASPDARRLRLRIVNAQAALVTAVEGVGEQISAGAEPVLIDLEDGTRVEAAPHTQLCAFARAKTLLLVAGQLHATRLHDAERAGSAPARIASLPGTLETNPGADLELRVELRVEPGAASMAYRAQLGLARGTVAWASLDDRAALERTELSAGAPLPKVVEGLQWRSSGVKSSPAQRWAAFRAQDADRVLDAALIEQQALRDRGHALLARVSPRHAALAKAPADLTTPEDSPREYQRALVEHARLRQAQAEQLLLAAERSLLGALASCGASSHGACASLQAWSERFSARVAGLL